MMITKAHEEEVHSFQAGQQGKGSAPLHLALEGHLIVGLL